MHTDSDLIGFVPMAAAVAGNLKDVKEKRWQADGQNYVVKFDIEHDIIAGVTEAVYSVSLFLTTDTSIDPVPTQSVDLMDRIIFHRPPTDGDYSGMILSAVQHQGITHG